MVAAAAAAVGRALMTSSSSAKRGSNTYKMVKWRCRLAVAAASLVARQASIAAFHFSVGEKFRCPKMTSDASYACKKTRLPMGLYDDEIDWDADLFGQIGKSNNDDQMPIDTTSTTSSIGQTKIQEVVGSDVALEDSKWDMAQSKSSSDVKSLRDRMKQSWGVDDKKVEGKPTADWMPGFGEGPDEDEPWFTG